MAILLVWDRAGDYHIARWRALQKIASPQAVLLADLGAGDSLYGWKSNLEKDALYFKLSKKSIDENDFSARFRAFQTIVKQHQVKTVGIAGYGRKEYLAMMWYAKMHNIRVVLFAESWYPGNMLIDTWKGKLIRFLADAFLVSGQKAKNHFINRLKVEPQNIRIGYSTVDNSHFFRINSKSSPPVLLCVARFSTEKNLLTLIQAFKASLLYSKWQLLLVGGGPQQPEIEKLISNDAQIQLRTWVGYDELPYVYSMATAFVLPSIFEPWGLVVNEAMAAGLPVLVSKQCGCQPDLVDETNGFVFDANAPDELITALNQLAETDGNILKNMGENGLEKIKSFSSESWAIAFKKLSKT